MESSKDYVEVAKRWHELLNALAPDFVDTPDDEVPTAWDDLPEGYRRLLAMVVTNLIAEGTIR
jgi:hypothetical protein